jgi:YD repeat-containing protein
MRTQFAALLALFLGLTAAFASAGHADNELLAPPPEKFVISGGGVDMRSGRYAYSHTDLSIGGDGGLALTRSMGQLGIAHASPFGSFSDNFDIFIQQVTVNMETGDFRPNVGGPDLQIQVLSNGLSQTFQNNGTTGWVLASRSNYGILTFTGSGTSTVYTYQDSGGDTMVFRPIGSPDCTNGVTCADISKLTRADGTVLTFGYDSDPVSGRTRLRSVTSTRGQGLLFEYSGMFVTKACVVNLAVIAMPTGTCPAGIPTATYTYDTLAGSQRLASVTDASGAVWKFVNGTMTDNSGSLTPASITMGFINPGETTPWLTNAIDPRDNDDGSHTEVISAQSFSDGRSYTYAYNFSPPDPPHVQALAGGTITDGQGNRTKVIYSFPVLPSSSPTETCKINPKQCSELGFNDNGGLNEVFQMTAGPTQVIDPLGRTTTANYCDPAATNGCVTDPAPVSMTDPSGIVTNMSWDFVFHHLDETDEVARTGSALPDIIRQQGYACNPPTVIKSCEEPSFIIDANGNETDFTYDPQHGGVLTEMGPSPAAGAARPLKLTTWVQKYAYILSGSSLVPAASPVWTKSTETVCQTVAGANNSNPVCDTAAPQRVTTYQYGDGQANSLLVRGAVVTADGSSRRTCYSYDNFGNRISETRPLAGLATCP